MKTACFIPIKMNSERVSGKNFRILNGRKLYEYIIQHVLEADCFDDVFVDTNSDEIKEYCEKLGINIIPRLDRLASNNANGNDLLVYHATTYPDYTHYAQAFATAPFLQAKSIRNCVNHLTQSLDYDSIFTANINNGFYWFNDTPVNYRPGILPRSQDMQPVIEETTGFYGIKKESLIKYQCRIGRKPFIYPVTKFEAVDINTEDDFIMAEYIGKNYFGEVGAKLKNSDI